jgi:hypothetical protein
MRVSDIQVTPWVYWAAGLLEGEACFDIRQSQARIRDPDNMHCRVIVEMKDRDVLEKLQEIFGGTLTEVKCKSKIKENWSTYHKWLLSKRSDVLACLRVIYPMMSQRRKQRMYDMILFLEDKIENR